MIPTWRPGVSLNLVSNQKYIYFEDNEIYLIQALNGMSGKTKYFIELYHQYGAIQDRHTKGLRDYKHKHESEHKAEH